MVLRVQKIGDEYGVIFPAEALEALRLSDGVEVELRPVDAATEHRYATVEEGLDAFRRTEHLHRHTYEELAK